MATRALKWVMRIRSIKPEFFVHEDLWEMERDTGLPIRLAYIGLWSASDKEGRFNWNPRNLKLLIMPFDDNLDFSRVLHAFATRGYLTHYSVRGEEFGWVKTFRKHQQINNRERESIIPPPTDPEAVEIVHNDDPPRQVSIPKQIAHASATREPRVSHASATCAPRQQGKPQADRDRDREMEGEGINTGRGEKPSQGVIPKPAEPRKPMGPPPTDLDDARHDFASFDRQRDAEFELESGTKPEPKLQVVDQLCEAVIASFKAKTAVFTNHAKERVMAKAFCKQVRAHSPDAPEELAEAMIKEFWRLTQSSDPFWNKHPFTPSRLASSGVFDSVKREVDRNQAANDMSWVDEFIAEHGEAQG